MVWTTTELLQKLVSMCFSTIMWSVTKLDTQESIQQKISIPSKKLEYIDGRQDGNPIVNITNVR